MTLGGVHAGKFVIVDPAGTTIEIFQLAAHAAGSVDVVVTNPGPASQTGLLTGGFTYAPPESFDFNGTGEGEG